MDGRERARATGAGTRRRRRRPHLGYSRFVAVVKIVLPALAVALIVLVALWPQFLLDGGRFRLTAGSGGAAEDIDRLSMVNPRFEGSDEKDRPFMVTVDLAIQDSADRDLVELTRPKADMTLTNGAWVALTAEHGRYHRGVDTLELSGGVNLFHDRGYEIHTTEATIDLAAGTAEGDRPVEAQGPFGELASEGFRVTGNGALIEFTGKSRLRLEPAGEVTP